MFPQPVDVETDGFGDLDLLEDLPETVAMADELPGIRIGLGLSERCDAQFHACPILVQSFLLFQPFVRRAYSRTVGLSLSTVQVAPAPSLSST